MKPLEKLNAKLAVPLCSVIMLTPGIAMASSGGSGDDVMGIIQQQITSLTSSSKTIIAGAIGLSAIFFGAKFVWTKFKSMAR
ncbi:MAG: hypothetical protein E6276_04195 [Clostridiales bacterium]|nr:hypothetical protein [Clostridiales bacterium]